jgi:hypothetical protein
MFHVIKTNYFKDSKSNFYVNNKAFSIKQEIQIKRFQFSNNIILARRAFIC